MRELGAAIRVLRAVRDVSQRALARVAGITPGMLCIHEKGKQKPSLPTLSRLVDVLRFRLTALDRSGPGHPGEGRYAQTQ